jgi:hypothetical protein
MSSRKAILAAAALLLALLGGGAIAWLATSGDEQNGSLPGHTDASASKQRTTPTPAQPDPAAPTEPTPTQTQPAQPAQPQPGARAKKHRTHFPTDRGKPQDDPPQRDFAIPPAREFTGTGNATLGNVDLRRPAVVKWTTNGRFELRFGREDFPITAPSASGQLIVPPYRFQRVRVIANGRWKISITPQK